MSAEDAFSGADMSEPQIRDFTTRHLITAREAIKAVMHPAGILVGCTCDPVVALGERRGAAPTLRPALLLRPKKDVCAAVTANGGLAAGWRQTTKRGNENGATKGQCRLAGL